MESDVWLIMIIIIHLCETGRRPEYHLPVVEYVRSVRWAKFVYLYKACDVILARGQWW